MPIDRLILILTLIGLGGVGVGCAHDGSEDDRITWQFEADRNRVQPGEKLRVQWTAELADGWHMYAIDSPEGAGVPLTVSTDRLDTVWAREGSFRQSETIQEYDPFFKKEVRYFEGTAVISTDLRLDEAAPPGTDTLRTSVRYQICDAELCLPPTNRLFTGTVTIKARSR